jgi:Flp pilus assembly protein TadD
LLSKNPHDRFAEISLWGLRSEREPQEALSQLRRMAWQDPDDGRVRAQIGLILARRGQLDRAIAELQVALRLDPANVRYRADLVALGEARRRGLLARNRSEAIEALAPKVE